MRLYRGAEWEAGVVCAGVLIPFNLNSMSLSEENKLTLLLNVHRVIEERASAATNNLHEGRHNALINYPPNGGLTTSEKEALEVFRSNETLRSAVRKIVASSIADAFFDHFNIVDGTSDPKPETSGWTGVAIIDRLEHEEEELDFLHDEFFSSYWNWKKARTNKNWSLDLGE